MSSTPLKLGVLLSGSGTTLDNLVVCKSRGELDVSFEIVLSNRPRALGLEKARVQGFPTAVFRSRDYVNVDTHSEAIANRLRESKVDLVVMAGFLCLWKIPNDFIGRVMNIHPSLLPAFGGQGFHGKLVHEAVHKSGVKVSGCTVHFANNAYDEGPIILQRTAPVFGEDTPEDIAARVFEQECLAYPEAIRLFQEGRIEIQGSRVAIRGERPPTQRCR